MHKPIRFLLPQAVPADYIASAGKSRDSPDLSLGILTSKPATITLRGHLSGEPIQTYPSLTPQLQTAQDQRAVQGKSLAFAPHLRQMILAVYGPFL